MKTFKKLLTELHACSEAREWAGNRPIEEVVEKCHRGDWLLWLAARVGVELRPLTLAKAHCANTVRHLMRDERSIKAVDAAIAYGEGRIEKDELTAAADAAADAAAYAAYDAADDAAYAAADAAYAAAYAAADAAYAAAYAAYDAADDAAENKEENQFQTADICRKYTGQLIVDKVNQKLRQ